MKLSDELKAALRLLPVKEKDKLLLRLVAKDAALVDKLTYELLEDGDDPTDRRETLRMTIGQQLSPADRKHFTPGQLQMELRHWNGRISAHVKATRDKYGDIDLRLWMLNEAFDRHLPMLRQRGAHRSRTLAPYLVQRTAYLLKALDKLHEDYHLDFRDDMNYWLERLHGFGPTASLAKAAGVTKWWEG